MMDTSKIYVRMCKGAGEIQRSGNDTRDFNNYYDQQESGLIWLPRQDQLQEMMKAKYERLVDRDPVDWFCFGIPGYIWSDEFGYGDDNEEIGYYRQFISMEQLWLAFVMKEKYDKAWNGKEWRDNVD